MSIFNSDLIPEVISSLLKDVKKSIRFVGILGSGMYPLACILRGRGYEVSGYDRNAKRDEYTDENGIKITRVAGNMPQNVGFCVYSLAIDESNSEIMYAKTHDVPLISRAQLRGALMGDYSVRISVSGTHGKSTTTALIDHILTVAGERHTTVSGATLSSGNLYADQSGKIFIAEACEYKDSFLCLSPTCQLITAVELDHTDYFADIDSIRASFIKAARNAQLSIINSDDPISSGIADELRKEGRAVLTYGKAACLDYSFDSVYTEGDTTFFTVRKGSACLRLRTSLIGEYNLYNITAAVAVADYIGIPEYKIADAISSFVTIGRRMELISTVDGVPVYYDYAHHPTEINAVITALKARYGSVTVIFKPHTYSRTKSLWRDFIRVLCKADFTILLDIYPARELPIEGVDSEALAKEIGSAQRSDDINAAELARCHAHGTIVLLGAGEVDSVKDAFVNMNNKS